MLSTQFFVLRRTLIILITFCSGHFCLAQPIPAVEENIPFLTTFGNEGETTWGDDDFCQIFFLVIPKDQVRPFFIRVFDPDIGGSIDEIKGKADTKTKFSIFGGMGTISDADATLENPRGNYKSGTLLLSKTFDNSTAYDKKWYTFGPFNPVAGELMPEYGGYVIKIIAEGIKGDDGNLYKYYLSTSHKENIKIEGANAFTFEYSFRLNDKAGFVSHIYPFIDKNVISIKVHTFDYDLDGAIRIVSVAKKFEEVNISGDNNWIASPHKVEESELNTSFDIQLVKLKNIPNNNVVFYITNQYGKLLPFFTSPIGGVPKYKYDIGIKPKK